MDFVKIIEDNFSSSIQTKQQTLTAGKEQITAAGKLLLATLDMSKKVLICGNGGSAADAQHFATELVMRYEKERQSLSAIALTTDTSLLTAVANDTEFANIFARQVEGLGQTGDLLIGISTSGNSKNVVNAIETAQKKGLKVIALTGKDGGIIKEHLNTDDVEICIPSNNTARVQEAHILIIHTLCNMADLKFTR